MIRRSGVLAELLVLMIGFCGSSHAAESGVVILENQRVALGVTTAGGAIVEFRLAGERMNPLNWTIHGLEPVESGKPYLRGHFLCLDRWGRRRRPRRSEGCRFTEKHQESTGRCRDLRSVVNSFCGCEWSVECRWRVFRWFARFGCRVVPAWPRFTKK